MKSTADAGISISDAISDDRSSLLIYRAGPFHLCSPLTDVESIVELPSYRSVPFTSYSTLGVINHRDRVVQVVSMRRKFGLQDAPGPTEGQLILAPLVCGLTGFLVDRVLDIAAFQSDQLIKAPSLTEVAAFDRFYPYHDQLSVYIDLEQVFHLPDPDPLILTDIDSKSGSHTESGTNVDPDFPESPVPAAQIARSSSSEPVKVKKMAPIPIVHSDNTADTIEPEVTETGKNCRSDEPEMKKNSCDQQFSVEATGHRPAKSQARPPLKGIAAFDNCAVNSCNPKTLRNAGAVVIRRSFDLEGTDRQPITYRLLTAILCLLLMPLIIIWCWPSMRPVDLEIREADVIPQTSVMRMVSDDSTGTSGSVAVADTEAEMAVRDSGRKKYDTEPVVAVRDSGRKNDDAEFVSATETMEQTVPPKAPIFKIETGSFRLTIERPDKKPGQAGSIYPASESSKLEQTYSPSGGNRQMVTHMVVRGDTLWDIAQTYMGDPFRYPELAKLSRIRDPDWIYPGDVVRIIKKSTD